MVLTLEQAKEYISNLNLSNDEVLKLIDFIEVIAGHIFDDLNSGSEE